MNPSSNPVTIPSTRVRSERTIILALDTSTEYCSVALLVAPAEADPFQSPLKPHDGASGAGECVVYSRHEHTGAVSSARLLPLIQSVIGEAAVSLGDCSAIAFGAGPGSFTGLRTATGVAQGLAFGLGLQVVPVGTLMACAEAARVADTRANCVVSALDARMDQAYWGLFDWQGAAHESAPMGWLCAPAAALDAPQALLAPPRPYTLAGNAAAAFGERLSVWAGAAQVAANALPNAVAIAALGWRGWSRGMAIDAALAAPLYVRDNVAQTTHEREAARASKDAEKAATEAAAHAVQAVSHGVTRA
ncbi:tRNA (adenosine(37)-N6)-threonylcarbamoyltransferase complex dimerization subunit type 1 TsaB [Burkholderia sp. L27(2015)]|uniref:tRNA (adenosine(37)-N6)-threonylcarbamoyltransferase complex dimerization subunit type 1 TsaB n=1 Tax=Burkholderia sp. L27(2015) TaxID=1641858 RepID=UPI00131B8120|nr:tRNA (adenosine(37)-N6)-threonylcarbamoyltransferase complex dimerization subunit type 1 TsaB [Burkholderia sp. L27(2015)]